MSMGKPRYLADIAHEVSWAALIVDAALPLYGSPVSPETVTPREQAADRSQLRAIAFGQVLAELMDTEFVAGTADTDRLLQGAMPEARYRP